MLGLLRLTGAVAAAALLLTAVPAEAAFVYTKVVDTHVAVPGGGGTKFVLQGPAAVGDGMVVFCDRSDGDKYDVWAANINGTGKRRIIREGRLMPRDLGTFKQTCHLIDIVGGNLLFVGDDCAGCGVGKGIFRMPVGGGTIASVVDIKRNFPNSQNKFTTDRGPGGDFSSDGKNVAFYNGQSIWAVPLGGGVVHEVASLADVNVSPPDPHCCIFSNPTMLGSTGKVALLGRNFFDGHALMSVNVSGATNTFRFLARWNRFLLGTPQGYVITRLFGPDTGSHYVFGAVSGKTGSPEIKGIYSKNPSTGTVVRLVNQNTRVPGRTDKFTMTFSGVYDPPIAAEGGIVVFASDDTGGKTGIYAVPEGGGTITTIVRAGFPLGNGRKVGSLGFGRRFFDGDTVVFTVSYAGNGFVGNGVYSTPVSGP